MIRTLRLFALFFAFLLAAFGAHAAGEPLPADQAFRATARAIDDKTVEVRFQVADDYYLYRHRFRFEADGISFGEPALPPGKPKKDDAFGEVERRRHPRVVGGMDLRVVVEPIYQRLGGQLGRRRVRRIPDQVGQRAVQLGARQQPERSGFRRRRGNAR